MPSSNPAGRTIQASTSVPSAETAVNALGCDELPSRGELAADVGELPVAREQLGRRVGVVEPVRAIAAVADVEAGEDDARRP